MAKIAAIHSKFFKLICAETLLAILLVAQSVSADQSPSNANPCIHQSSSVQSGKNESTCHKHPSKWIELPDEAIQKLKIDAGFGWGIFSGTIYNGNENYHVTQLIVSMTPIHGHHHMDMHANMSHDPKTHQINLDLPPLSKGALSMPLASEDAHVHDFEWKIIKVMGYQAH
ncbi:hypothetical protein [Nitrosomonas sp.]|uniref:hypothetical protein n=1 Tax=Nitrosomonas sp. TaxID=42353 RepID=UPI0025FE1FA2|nr:hypothetical protein [Nitrosomonas sp.]